MRTRLLAAIALAGLLALSGACGDDDDEDAGDTTETTAEASDSDDLVTMKTDLKGGAEEVPNPGDPDGSGKAEVTLDKGKNEVCYEIEVENIAAPSASHIHQGAKGASGGIVVTFDHTKIGQGKSCVASDKAVLDQIAANPANFYVNVHTGDFPGGAVRGQLEAS